MSKELEALKEARNHRHEKDKNLVVIDIDYLNKCIDGLEIALKDLQDENKLLRENVENLDETYFDTWYACERLKKNSDYALMFVDNTYCLVDTKDNKFDVIENYKITNKGIIDNESLEKLLALEIIKRKQVSVADFIYACMCSEKDLKEYYNCDSNYEFAATCVGWGKDYLTKEEYDILKGVLL